MLTRSREESKRFIKVVVDLVALAAQATGFVVWPLLEGREKPELWLIPFTVVLISCGWWENYINIPKDSHTSKLPRFPYHPQSKYYTQLYKDTNSRWTNLYPVYSWLISYTYMRSTAASVV
jgi:hypothetical protein